MVLWQAYLSTTFPTLLCPQRIITCVFQPKKIKVMRIGVELGSEAQGGKVEPDYLHRDRCGICRARRLLGVGWGGGVVLPIFFFYSKQCWKWPEATNTARPEGLAGRGVVGLNVE